MQHLDQSPKDTEFVQNPYPFYDRARASGPFFYWTDYAMVCATSHTGVSAILRDRRFGREIPAPLQRPVPPHLAPFYAVEAHSMLELEPPRHTRLRRLVLRAFTSRRIAALTPEITQLCHDLIDAVPTGPFDLLTTFAQRLPVTIIARLLGVPEDRWRDLMVWSNAMVGMYVAARTRAAEDAAVAATIAFTTFLRAHIDARRTAPADDLITHLIEAEESGDRLTTDEMISTCILLLNAGHEATVHAIGNAAKLLLQSGVRPDAHPIAATVEELLRLDPPLHMFTRYAYEPVEVLGHRFQPGDQVALLLASANRDPDIFSDPAALRPNRAPAQNLAFGGGLHFCVGAPLARLEMELALPVLFNRLPNLRLTGQPAYADTYHFHGLSHLMVRAD